MEVVGVVVVMVVVLVVARVPPETTAATWGSKYIRVCTHTAGPPSVTVCLCEATYVTLLA